eukprot:c26084_g1_i3 orf=239-1855(+)
MEALTQARSWANQALSQYEPLLILVSSVVASFIFFAVFPLLGFLEEAHYRGLRPTLFGFLMKVACMFPGVSKHIQEKKDAVVERLQRVQNSERESWQSELPQIGMGSAVLERLQREKSRDVHWQGRSSGAVYIGGNEFDGHFATVNESYKMFSHTNPLHPDLFPSVLKFEVEIVAMTASMLGSKDKAAGGQICGNVTSGGTESILLAVKSTRDYMKSLKGITKPEMIIAESAHSAYEKAAQYFQIKVWQTPVNKEFQADVKRIKSLVNKNTILIVGSAPGFPHGIIDPIDELGALAMQKGICFHVDLCLGGFVLPFACKLGYHIRPFDFTVQGVTSISVDLHKYGLAPKGTSVVLYRHHKIRQHQFVAVTEWSGGLYVSPTIAGSRPGGLIAGAWASMMSLGLDGYMEAARQVMETSEKLKKGIDAIPELYILGKPDMTIIAFGSHEVDIYKVNDAMASRGWNLNALHRPISLHFCVTLQHINVLDDFLKDLSSSVSEVKEKPGSFEDGMAPIYGAAARMPDRGTVKDLLIAYMDNAY